MTLFQEESVAVQPYLCSLNSPTRDALAKINELTHQFLIVIDSNGKPIGTLTDGDIRRGLLKGLSLESPVNDFMYREFKFGMINDTKRNLELINDEKRPVPFLPIVDESGNVKSVLIRGAIEPKIDTAVIMAGGFGTRLGDLTKSTPKPLVDVGGRPILEHVLTSLEQADIRKIYITVHYRADQIRHFVESRTNQAIIEFIEESKPLGTAGSLSLLPIAPKAPFLVVNGDVVTDVDFTALSSFYFREKLDGILCVSPFYQQIPYGVVVTDKNGHLRDIQEKPRKQYNVSSGIYILSNPFLNLLTKNQCVDMPELILRAKDFGFKIGVFPIHEYWIDLGQKKDIEAFKQRTP
jgi:dTDP-glucose pyrophosphorylase